MIIWVNEMKKQNLCWISLAILGIVLYGNYLTGNASSNIEVEMILGEGAEGDRYVGRYYEYFLTLNNTGDSAVEGILRVEIDLDIDWDDQIWLWINGERLVFVEEDEIYANYSVRLDAGEIVEYVFTFYCDVVVEYDIDYVFYVIE